MVQQVKKHEIVRVIPPAVPVAIPDILPNIASSQATRCLELVAPPNRTLHVAPHPHAAYFEGISFEKLSTFNQLCEAMYSNIATLNTLDVNEYPDLPDRDKNLIKLFQQNNNILNEALSPIKSTSELKPDPSKIEIKDTKTNLQELINTVNYTLINLNDSLFLNHLCQTTDPNSLSEIRRKQTNGDTRAPIKTINSLSQKALRIGVNRFYLEFLNKILDKVHSRPLRKTSRTIKEKINTNYVKYLQELVKYEQELVRSRAVPNQTFSNLTADEIIPPDLNFFPPTAPPDYPLKLLQFWENVLQNERVDNKNYDIIRHKGIENKEKKEKNSPQHAYNDGLLTTVGSNCEYLKQENFEIRTLGNYSETRLLIGLQALAKHRDDLTIIAPNTVGWLNNKLKTDVLIIKQDEQDTKILALDCKSSREAASKYNKDRKTPSVAYHPPRSNLYFNHHNLPNPNQELSNDLKTLFQSKDAYLNLDITNKIKTSLTDTKIFSNPSKNFYQLKDTTEARALEQTISEALQSKYNEKQR